MSAEIVALFGGTGSTGNHALTLALEQGYKVQAMVRTPSKIETKNDNLTLIEGDFENDEAIQNTIKGAHYVLCFAGGKPFKCTSDMMTNFVKKLVPMLKNESQLKAFLYQAGAFSSIKDAPNPAMMKVMKYSAGIMMGIRKMIQDNDAVGNYLMDLKGDDKLNWIVTRPAALKEGEGGTKLEASDSPPMGPICFKDLAAFSLEAVKDESLYGKCPFVKPAANK